MSLPERSPGNQLTLTENHHLSLMDVAFNPPPDSSQVICNEIARAGNASFANRYSADRQMPVSKAASIGPVAQFAVGDVPAPCPTCDFAADQHAERIASPGWRIDSSFGWITPRAQLCYSRLVNDDHPLSARERQTKVSSKENAWMDVSVDASVPLGQNMAAFAVFSQNGAVNSLFTVLASPPGSEWV